MMKPASFAAHIYECVGRKMSSLARMLQRHKDKLSLVVQRDVRKASNVGGSRWPSQTTVYERLGSLSATPRHSPTPVHHSLSNLNPETHSVSGQYYDPPQSNYSSPGVKRFSDPMGNPNAPSYARPYHLYEQHPTHFYGHRQPYSHLQQPRVHMAHHPMHNHAPNYAIQQRMHRQMASGLHDHPPQSMTPSSIMTQSSAAGSPRSYPGAVIPTSDNISCHEDCSAATAPPDFHHQHQQHIAQLPTALYQRHADSLAGGSNNTGDIQVIKFRKGTGSLGIR